VVSTSSCAHRYVWEAWTDIWHVSRTGLQFAKLHARKRPSQDQLTVTEIQALTDQIPNDSFLPHSQLSAENVSFSEPFHQGGDVGLRVQGRECVGHRPQVVVGVGDTAKVSIWDSWSFSSVAWKEAMGGWQWMTCLMP